MTTETSQKKTALIVGASRGLGMAVAAEYLRRGWHVIATIRQATGSAESQALQAAAGAALEVLQLEMTSSAQIEALGRRLDGRAIDLLFGRIWIHGQHGIVSARASRALTNAVV